MLARGGRKAKAKERVGKRMTKNVILKGVSFKLVLKLIVIVLSRKELGPICYTETH